MTQDCETCRKLTWCESSCGGASYEPKVLKIAFREFRKWMVRLIMDVFGEEKDEDEDDDYEDDLPLYDEDDYDEEDHHEAKETPDNTFVCPACGHVIKEVNYDNKKL